MDGSPRGEARREGQNGEMGWESCRTEGFLGTMSLLEMLGPSCHHSCSTIRESLKVK